MIPLPGFIYALLKDLGTWGLARVRGRRLSPAEVIRLRAKWKAEFEEHLYQTRKQKLREDVIIRDIKRMDTYPDLDDKAKGISPWFRAGLVGTYHKGALIGLEWSTLKADAKGEWRFTDYNKGETGDIRVILIGYVPFENIESVDWRGDEYYPFPHLYCYFDARRKEPYEKVAFCEKREMDGIPYYTEVASYDSVQKRSPKFGIARSSRALCFRGRPGQQRPALQSPPLQSSLNEEADPKTIFVPRMDTIGAKVVTDEADLLKMASSQHNVNVVMHIATKLNTETQAYVKELVSILEAVNIISTPEALAPTAELEFLGRIRELMVLLKGNDVMVYAEEHYKRLPERWKEPEMPDPFLLEAQLILVFGPPPEWGENWIAVPVDNGQPHTIPYAPVGPRTRTEAPRADDA
jgi:hypothetical protein